jgi:outer membrane protein OmpA-like peptidoglycan-associated protein
VAHTGIYFPENGHKLNKASKAALDQLVSANSNLAGYVVEITGYTSSTGSAQHNQRLSEQRAAAVAQYLRVQDNVPAWRIAVPAGYGETHPAAENSNRDGRAKNRRVEVTILVSKGSQESTQISSAQ